MQIELCCLCSENLNSHIKPSEYFWGEGLVEMDDVLKTFTVSRDQDEFCLCTIIRA